MHAENNRPLNCGLTFRAILRSQPAEGHPRLHLNALKSAEFELNDSLVDVLFLRIHNMSTTQIQPQNQAVTAENVIRLFPEVDSHLASSHNTQSSHDELQGYDEEQIRLMDEVCIVLDNDDNPIGSASKKTCTPLSLPNSPATPSKPSKSPTQLIEPPLSPQATS